MALSRDSAGVASMAQTIPHSSGAVVMDGSAFLLLKLPILQIARPEIDQPPIPTPRGGAERGHPIVVYILPPLGAFSCIQWGYE